MISDKDLRAKVRWRTARATIWSSITFVLIAQAGQMDGWGQLVVAALAGASLAVAVLAFVLLLDIEGYLGG